MFPNRPGMMKSRSYEELPWTSATDPDPAVRHASEGRAAVKIAHAAELERIRKHLELRQSVLVVGEKRLTPFVLAALGESTTLRLTQAAENRSANPTDDRRSAQLSARMIARLHEQLREAARHTDRVAVIPHLDLSWVSLDGPCLLEANEMVYWLAEYSQATVLAFWDPHFQPPKILDAFFPHRVSLESFRRDVLWQIISADEARRVSVGQFSLPAQLTLYQYLSGVSVVDGRRIMRELMAALLPGCQSPDDVRKSLDVIRKCTPGGGDDIVAAEPLIAGYSCVRDRLLEEVVAPVERRLQPIDEQALARADAMIPRGVIFAGPPGTGKTEWGRWLAWRLRWTLLAVHGPDLKRPLVGETEAAIRKLFADARRAAPSLILMDELDALLPARTATNNHDSSMVAQFLSEMDGLRRDENILVVGGTNLASALDPAFFRPGRFGVCVEVGYPTDEDRRAILDHYNRLFDLRLTNDSLARLVQLTRGPLNARLTVERRQHRAAYVQHAFPAGYEAQAGAHFSREIDREFGLMEIPEFAGDHLRACCLYLLRHTTRDKQFDMNDESALVAAVESVRRSAWARGDRTPAAAPRRPLGFGAA